MAEKTILVCDRCGGDGAQRVQLVVGSRKLVTDLCPTHLTELTSAARPLRRARRSGSAGRKTSARRPSTRASSTKKGSTRARKSRTTRARLRLPLLPEAAGTFGFWRLPFFRGGGATGAPEGFIYWVTPCDQRVLPPFKDAGPTTTEPSPV